MRIHDNPKRQRVITGPSIVRPRPAVAASPEVAAVPDGHPVPLMPGMPMPMPMPMPIPMNPHSVPRPVREPGYPVSWEEYHASVAMRVGSHPPPTQPGPFRFVRDPDVSAEQDPEPESVFSRSQASSTGGNNMNTLAMLAAEELQELNQTNTSKALSESPTVPSRPACDHTGCMDSYHEKIASAVRNNFDGPPPGVGATSPQWPSTGPPGHVPSFRMYSGPAYRTMRGPAESVVSSTVPSPRLAPLDRPGFREEPESDGELPPPQGYAYGSSAPSHHAVGTHAGPSTYFTPSGSPVLGPLRNMSIRSARTTPNTPYGSRPGSPVLNLPRPANRVSVSPPIAPGQAHGLGLLVSDTHSHGASHQTHRHRSHPYSPGSGSVGSDTARARAGVARALQLTAMPSADDSAGMYAPSLARSRSFGTHRRDEEFSSMATAPKRRKRISDLLSAAPGPQSSVPRSHDTYSAPGSPRMMGGATPLTRDGSAESSPASEPRELPGLTYNKSAASSVSHVLGGTCASSPVETRATSPSSSLSLGKYKLPPLSAMTPIVPTERAPSPAPAPLPTLRTMLSD